MDVSPARSTVIDMDLVSVPAGMFSIAQAWRSQGFKIGLVPTMGFLHEAHASLMREARRRSDRVVVSIFVNPTQFGPGEDFQNYPRDLDRDLALCRKEKVDAVFHPSPEAMYPKGDSTVVENVALSDVIEGARRPGHFRGVATVVSKLFLITQPHFAVFGEKDAQQLAVIQQMVRDLHFPVSIVPAPILREPDGLAMSSRNVYLSPEERAQAVCLFQGLEKAAGLFQQGCGDGASLLRAVTDRVAEARLGKLDYAELVDADSFAPVQSVDRPARILLVVRFGKTRLLDNVLLLP